VVPEASGVVPFKGAYMRIVNYKYILQRFYRKLRLDLTSPDLFTFAKSKLYDEFL